MTYCQSHCMLKGRVVGTSLAAKPTAVVAPLLPISGTAMLPARHASFLSHLQVRRAHVCVRACMRAWLRVLGGCCVRGESDYILQRHPVQSARLRAFVGYCTLYRYTVWCSVSCYVRCLQFHADMLMLRCTACLKLHLRGWQWRPHGTPAVMQSLNRTRLYRMIFNVILTHPVPPVYSQHRNV